MFPIKIGLEDCRLSYSYSKGRFICDSDTNAALFLPSKEEKVSFVLKDIAR